MNWSSWSEFAAMGGYGLYVWGSFGAVALAIAGELASLSLRRRALRHRGTEDVQTTHDAARPRRFEREAGA